MTIGQSIILGIVQGLTEFLPISSSAHLVLAPKLLGWQNLLHQNPIQISFDVVLHLGSLLALLVYFRKDILSLITERSEQNNKLLLFLVIGTIPAVIAGVLFNGFFEELFGSTSKTAFLLIITGLIIFTAESLAKLKRGINIINTKDSLIIGLAQALAIAPGISRSGATISAGLMLGFKREDAAHFSFLLAIPAVLGAFIFSLNDAGLANMLNVAFLGGLVSSFAFSYIAIKFLLGYLQRRSLKIFAAYCVIAGVAFLIVW